MYIEKFYLIGKNHLFPICRSLTGNGVKKTLNIIKKNFPKLKVKSINSGSKVFDWKIPSEWNVKDAYVLDKFNKKIIDFKKNNLHLVGYSKPINKKIGKTEFLNHLHTLKKKPYSIPYITSYYKKYWGFCSSHVEKRKFLKKYTIKDKFKVVINSNFRKKGKLRYAEYFLKGKSKQEILISTYVCHPSLANDNLSGIMVSMALINFFMKKKDLKKSLRFIFVPETIGSIAFLNKNLDELKRNIIGGYNLTCIGDEKQHSCMFSKYQNSQSDNALKKAYDKLKIKYKIYSFLERGSDERQYNSPGIDLPISSIFRSKYDKFKEYHTSDDDFKLVTKKGLDGGFKVAKTALEILLDTKIPKANFLCEPQMGKRGLYKNLSQGRITNNIKKMMDFIQYSDGKNSLEEISKIIKLNGKETIYYSELLKKKKIISF